jgi:hypothetical protein
MYTWDKSANLTLVSTSGSNATFSRHSSGDAHVRILVSGVEVARKTLSTLVNVPNSMDFTASCAPESNNRFSGQAPAFSTVFAGDQYEWSSSTSSWTISAHSMSDPDGIYMSRVLIQAPSSSSSSTIIRVRAHNACGWGDWKIVATLNSSSSYYSALSYPNPVSGALTVDISVDQEALAATLTAASAQSGFSSVLAQNPTFQIKLYSSMGALVKETISPAGTVTLDVSNLPSGTYFLQVYDGTQSEPLTQTIIVSH